eukprot:Gregarina_sp_Pseudo_9__3865@NODE_400_length_2922_cov_313_993410_g377_i0_p1_GENE_NODE_400_length_2922_cov_313_993410_g377_i0NODE_400_length_2922_cov_313_993410_g377_i0_p1_ORF_typecomplete_len440_score104_57Oxidored_FMN/PF00724_20/4_7e100Oxidored_FMN/PF00724_20/1_7e03Dus/PF01207_17/0_0014DUF2870/PF11069_8/1_9DUF2870/PF11069_8/67DHO_dh/PF01180_21/2_3e02DHO_dh/PF01180_21/1_3Polyhedrin/PF00738_18/0_32_NODE_400_length_2922_cov_313_993410_g377_i014912810
MTTESDQPLITQPFVLKGLTLPNRVVVSPMCTFMAEAGTGLANLQHLVHYASLAEGGAGLIIVESVSVTARGYLTPKDVGLWEDAQVASLKRVTDYVHKHTQAKIAVQLNHAGRKAQVEEALVPEQVQLKEDDPLGGEIFAPSPLAHGSFRVPKAMTQEDMDSVKKAFAEGAKRAIAAGFDALEVSLAHGFLLHTFLSPISNKRTDDYGGSFENRIRFPLEVVEAVRNVMPDSMPLVCRLSCTDWIDGGWTIEDSVGLSKQLKAKDVNLIDCSSGGLSLEQNINPEGGEMFQVPFAETIREQADIATIAVGGISTWQEACSVLDEHRADLVALGRAHLNTAYWARQGVMSTGAVPWHPPRQMMGFMASKRRQAKEAEQQAASQKATLGKPAGEQTSAKPEPKNVPPPTTKAEERRVANKGSNAARSSRFWCCGRRELST